MDKSHGYKTEAREYTNSGTLHRLDDKEPSIKDVRIQTGGGLSSADILVFRCGQGGLQMRTSALFGETSDFSKYRVCLHGQGGRECQFFLILCGRPLWTAPNTNATYLHFTAWQPKLLNLNTYPRILNRNHP